VPECGEWNSLVEERVGHDEEGARPERLPPAVNQRAVAYTGDRIADDVRVSSGVTEFDRVLVGIVPGTLAYSAAIRESARALCCCKWR